MDFQIRKMDVARMEATESLSSGDMVSNMLQEVCRSNAMMSTGNQGEGGEFSNPNDGCCSHGGN